jgi:hypothetical protein
VLSSDVTANRTTESVVADNMSMVTGLRSGKHTEFTMKFTSSRTAKRRKGEKTRLVSHYCLCYGSQ